MNENVTVQIKNPAGKVIGGPFQLPILPRIGSMIRTEAGVIRVSDDKIDFAEVAVGGVRKFVIEIEGRRIGDDGQPSEEDSIRPANPRDYQ